MLTVAHFLKMSKSGEQYCQLVYIARIPFHFNIYHTFKYKMDPYVKDYQRLSFSITWILNLLCAMYVFYM